MRATILGVALVAGLTVALNAPAVAQDEPVEFADDELKAAVEIELGVSDPTPGDMLRLSELDAPRKHDQDALDACLCLVVALHAAFSRECLVVGDLQSVATSSCPTAPI